MYEMTKERAMELSAHSRFGCQMVAKDIKDTPLAKDKDVCIQVVSRYGHGLAYFPDFQDDEEIVLIAVNSDSYALANASPRLQNKDNVVLAAMNGENNTEIDGKADTEEEREKLKRFARGNCLMFGGPDIKDNKDIVLKAVGLHGQALEYASKRLKKDEEVVLTAIASTSNGYNYADISLQEREDIAEKAFSKNSGFYLNAWWSSLPPKFQNKKFALLYMQNDHPSLVANHYRHLPEPLRNDIDVTMAAIENNIECYNHIETEELKTSRKLAMLVITKDTSYYSKLHPMFKQDKEIVQIVAKEHHSVLSNIRTDLLYEWLGW